jgi:hypothetical protein
LATELLHELGVRADDAVPAFDVGLARGNPRRRLLVGSKGRLGVVVAVHDDLPGSNGRRTVRGGPRWAPPHFRAAPEGRAEARFAADQDAGQATREDGCVKPIYPDSGDGDRETHPEAVPGLRPIEGAADGTSLTLEVDGEMFVLRPNEFGGTDYRWLSGPNAGYGFGVSPTPNLSLGEHMENIRDFLAIVDPTTGYIEDDEQ